jgi:hypothetical protein
MYVSSQMLYSGCDTNVFFLYATPIPCNNTTTGFSNSTTIWLNEREVSDTLDSQAIVSQNRRCPSLNLAATSPQFAAETIQKDIFYKRNMEESAWEVAVLDTNCEHEMSCREMKIAASIAPSTGITNTQSATPILDSASRPSASIGPYNHINDSLHWGWSVVACHLCGSS